MSTFVPTSRRYNAVLLAHPRLVTGPDMPSAWSALTGDQVGRASRLGHWTTSHVQHVSAKNFYSASLAQEAFLRTTDGFVHDLLVASSDPAGNGRLLVAAPYVYFLGDVLRRLADRLGQPRPRYQVVHMGAAFQRFADPPDVNTRVRQFSVQNRDSSSADRLSVAGRNPLQSELGHQFASDAGEAAFGLRIEARFHGEYRTNVNMDRHGNFWWFHRGPGSLTNVLECIDVLHACDLLGETRNLPTDHKDDDD